jgi:hypothetical protein
MGQSRRNIMCLILMLAIPTQKPVKLVIAPAPLNPMEMLLHLAAGRTRTTAMDVKTLAEAISVA